MKKVILEEIGNMKYLLGYKRGVVVSEQVKIPVVNQDEDNTLNPDIVNKAEQGAPAALAAPAAPAAPASTEIPNPTIKMGVKNPRVQLLQQLLNDKFQSGLAPDGKYGPKTANAIYKNIIAISKSQLNPASTLGNVKPVVQQPASAPVAAPVAAPVTK